MFRIKHLIPTAAVLIATAGVLAPVAQAKAEAPYPRFAPNEHVTRIVDHVPRAGERPWIHYTPLAYPGGDRTVVTARTATTGGGIDWTFPAMGAIAVVLITMVAGDRLINRRRGQLAT